jgi:hypothetical protein
MKLPNIEISENEIHLKQGVKYKGCFLYNYKEKEYFKIEKGKVNYLEDFIAMIYLAKANKLETKLDRHRCGRHDIFTLNTNATCGIQAITYNCNNHLGFQKTYKILSKHFGDFLGYNKKRKPYYTYIMYDKPSKLYKIGKSVNPKRREKTLRSSVPFITMLGIIDKNVEKQLHDKFSDKRKRGEWFKLNNQDILFLENTFNIKLCPK